MSHQLLKYIGVMKQPIQLPDTYNPTMYIAVDHRMEELCLILLTPCCFLHAHRAIQWMNTQRVRLFSPSLRPEWISDIFNLYMTERTKMDILTVYPKKFHHDDFTKGQLVQDEYVNGADHDIRIRYIENPNVDDAYDIKVSNAKGYRYFSQYLTEEKLDALYEDSGCLEIHVPYTSTMYGGLNYLTSGKIHHKYWNKLQAHSFASIDERSEFTSCKQRG